jgi:hypothetical protein
MWSRIVGKTGGIPARWRSPDLPFEGHAIEFRDGKAALEFIAKYMKSEWKRGSILIGLAGKVVFEQGILAVQVLAPKDGILEKLLTFTEVKSVSTQTAGTKALNSNASLLDLGLREGDLVAVVLAGRPTHEVRVLGKQIAFVVARLDPVYDAGAGGWKMTHRYEM